MKLQANSFYSIEQLQEQYLNKNTESTPVKTTEGKTFQEILESSQTAGREVRFSKHAAGRLAERNIELTRSQMDRLTQGARQAQQKGIRESLVLMDQMAFIVNIPSNTVVTAMNQADTQQNIFTNIDGAVII